MVISSFAIGVLGKSLFYLGFVDAILVVLFFNLLGIMSVCFFSSFGPLFGLRQMILSRFWYGFYGVYISMSATLSLAIALIDQTQSHFSTSLHVLDGRLSTSL